MDFMTLAKARYSCRKFDTEKIVEQEKIDKIIEVGMAAPTAVNKQPFKIFEIKRDKTEKLKKATPFTFDAPIFLLVGANKNEAYVRSFDNKNFAEIDATIAATHMLLEVQDLGLGATWVAHFDEKVLKTEFPQLNDYNIVAIFPIGYPAKDAEINPLHYQSKAKDKLFEEI